MSEEQIKKVLVLLSDTDPMLTRVYRNKFQKNEGWEVTITASHGEAMELIKKEKPQIVVSDIILNKGNGFALLEDVRGLSDKTLANTPVVILTDLNQADDRERADKLGATAYLVKSQTTLNEVIDEVKKLV